MIGMTPRGRRAILGGAVVAMVSVAGCTLGGASPGKDKAGGSGEPVTLLMANPNGDTRLVPPVQDFIERVQQTSGGQIQIKRLDRYGDFTNGTERTIVHDTASGEVDLGWVGTRVFDTMGVTSMQALTAPMLIDSYALEDAVIDAGVTDEMLHGLDHVGVVGLGVLADGLRKPMGVHGPIVDVDDWRGIGFSTFPSQGQADAIAALGATPAQLYAKGRDEAVENGRTQGFEMGLLVARGRDHLYGTLNVTLWPQMDVLIANPDSLDALTPEQRGWLQEAAKAAAQHSAELSDSDEQSVREECDKGLRFALASPTDLVALRKRFDPLYAELEESPETKAFIGQIEELKKATTPDPALVIPASCTGMPPTNTTPPTGTTPAYLNGVYRWTITREDAVAAGSADDPDYPATNTIWLQDGTCRRTGGDHCVYWVNGDRISFRWPVYGPTVETFTFARNDHGDLTLEPILPMDHGDAVLMSAVPWTKIG